MLTKENIQAHVSAGWQVLEPRIRSVASDTTVNSLHNLVELIHHETLDMLQYLLS